MPLNNEAQPVDPLIERRCQRCGATLTSQEVQASLETGGPYLCTVHAAEELPADAAELDA